MNHIPTLLNALDSIETIIATDSKDYSLSKRDFYIWGIVCGWDDASFQECQGRFDLSDEEITRIKKLHDDFICRKQIVSETK